MKLHFDARDWDAQLLRALSFAYYEGSDVSECLTISSRIDPQQIDSWYNAWLQEAHNLFERGEQASQEGNTESARQDYLRASSYAKFAMAFLYPTHTDARFLAAYDLHSASFHLALPLFDRPVTHVDIPYQHHRTLTGFFFSGSLTGDAVPTLIVTGGYTSTKQENFFALGAAALQRGWNVFCFDGPGQGDMLYKQGCPMTYAWEEVITPIIHTLSVRSDVDPQSMLLAGLGWGSLLASRAAALEPRVHALVTYPGHYDALLGLERSIPHLREFLEKEEKTQIHQAFEKILSNKTLGNKFCSRMWIHGVESVYALLKNWSHYHLRELGPLIQCPTLVCDAEDECLNEGQAKLFFDSLTCPKEYFFFKGVNGSGEHCEAGVSASEHEKIFNWVAQTLVKETCQ